jgi:hypothetical protein
VNDGTLTFSSDKDHACGLKVKLQLSTVRDLETFPSSPPFAPLFSSKVVPQSQSNRFCSVAGLDRPVLTGLTQTSTREKNSSGAEDEKEEFFTT